MGALVALTGASGEVASLIRPALSNIYALRSSDVRAPAPLFENERYVRANLRSLSAMRRALRGAQAAIHLGGVSKEASFENILEANIRGVYNLFEAARLEGIRRVVFASTGHVTGFYARSAIIDESATVRPDTLYAASKVFGEAVGRLYADKYGMEVVCIRIGHVSVQPMYDVDRHIWISPRDLAQLLEIALERTPLHFEVLYGVSDNRLRWWSLDRARELGYRPKDAATERVTLKRPGPPTVGELVQGESFAARGFAGDMSRLWRPAQSSP